MPQWLHLCTSKMCAQANMSDGQLYSCHAARSPSREQSERELNQILLVRPPNPLWQGEWRGLSKQGWQEETISKNSGCCLRQAWGFGSPAWPGVEEFSLVPSAAHSFIAGNSPAPSHLCPRSFKPKLAKVIWINSTAAKWWLRCLRGLMQDHHCITAEAQTAFQAGEGGVSTKSCNWKRYT